VTLKLIGLGSARTEDHPDDAGGAEFRQACAAPPS